MKFHHPDGATPIDDISCLKLKWVRTQQELNRAEGENINAAAEKYLLKTIAAPTNWFTIEVLVRIHREMFSEVWDWAEEFRKTEISPGITPYKIPLALRELYEDVKFWQTEPCDLSVIEQAARVHHKLVQIHPFPNGNGRFSRLVADRYIKGMKATLLNWPIDLDLDGKARKLYIASLREADKGHYDPLVAYMTNLGAAEK